MPRKTYDYTRKPQDQLIRSKLRKQAQRLLSRRAIAGLATEVIYVIIMIIGAAALMAVALWWQS